MMISKRNTRRRAFSPLAAIPLCWAAAGALLIVADPAPRPTSAEDEQADDLGERLIRKAVKNADEDVMERIIRAMDEAARKLEVEFDAGDETQAIQARIVSQLDDAIQQAAMQRRRQRRSDPAARSDKRRMPKKAGRRKPKRADGAAQRADDASQGDKGKGASSVDGGLSGGNLSESRRGWGSLPLRERDEVLQGIGEQFLERYRGWIERYYRSLQEAPE